MKKIRYVVLYIPFVLGVGLYSHGVVNLVSSLLLFLGGYVAIKNTFDYRLNKDITINNNENMIRVDTKPREISSGVNKKIVKRNTRVRKRVKQ